jgi:hypothetical protein
MIGQRNLGIGSRPGAKTQSQGSEMSFASKLAILQSGWQSKEKPKENNSIGKTAPGPSAGVGSLKVESDRKQNDGFVGFRDFEKTKSLMNQRETIIEERFESSPTLYEAQEPSEVMVNKYQAETDDPNNDSPDEEDHIDPDESIKKKTLLKKKKVKKSKKPIGSRKEAELASEDSSPGNDLIGKNVS